jgi:type IV secretory pathway VirB6-like protein
MLIPEGYTCQLFRYVSNVQASIVWGLILDRDTGCPRVSKFWTVKLAAGTWSQFNSLPNQAGYRVNLDNALSSIKCSAV